MSNITTAAQRLDSLEALRNEAAVDGLTPGSSILYDSKKQLYTENKKPYGSLFAFFTGQISFKACFKPDLARQEDNEKTKQQILKDLSETYNVDINVVKSLTVSNRGRPIDLIGGVINVSQHATTVSSAKLALINIAHLKRELLSHNNQVPQFKQSANLETTRRPSANSDTTSVETTSTRTSTQTKKSFRFADDENKDLEQIHEFDKESPPSPVEESSPPPTLPAA